MKHAGMAPVCWLLLVGFPTAQVLTLYPGSDKITKSSRNVAINVIAEGKPLKDVKVEFCQIPQNETCLSSVTGDDGKSAFLPLRPGNYSLHATTKNGVIATELKFHTSQSSKANQFTVDMTGEIRFAVQLITYGEGLPIESHLQRFQGFTQDHAGSAVPEAYIRVVRKADKEGENPILLHSDRDGYFSAHLEDGFYIAFFRRAGFVTQTVAFEITAQGEEKNMTVQLTHIADLLPY